MKVTKEDCEVTLGADPELELYQTTDGATQPNYHDGFVRANHVIRQSTEDRVGTDCNSRIIEIRPEEAKDPTTVAVNCRNLMKELSARLQGNSTGELVVAVAGGGAVQSIGGHIHLGNSLLKKLSSTNLPDLLGSVLDDFLYIPIRKNMPGAIRMWGESPRIAKDGECGFKDDNEKVVKTAIDLIGSRHAYSTYDIESAWRLQPHGLEYRSLPSFICDFTLTRLVLKLAKGITENFLTSMIEKRVVKYNNPPIEKDYIKYLTPKEYRVWMTYMSGFRRNRFITSAFKNWGITPTKSRCFLIGCDEMCNDDYLSSFGYSTRQTADAYNEILLKFNSPMVSVHIHSQPSTRSFGSWEKQNNLIYDERSEMMNIPNSFNDFHRYMRSGEMVHQDTEELYSAWSSIRSLRAKTLKHELHVFCPVNMRTSRIPCNDQYEEILKGKIAALMLSFTAKYVLEFFANSILKNNALWNELDKVEPNIDISDYSKLFKRMSIQEWTDLPTETTRALSESEWLKEDEKGRVRLCIFVAKYLAMLLSTKKAKTEKIILTPEIFKRYVDKISQTSVYGTQANDEEDDDTDDEYEEDNIVHQDFPGPSIRLQEELGRTMAIHPSMGNTSAMNGPWNSAATTTSAYRR
jgi:hypothetical protein